MIEVRKLKSSDAAQRNPAIKYVIQLGENRQYFTEKALIELQNKLNTFALHGVSNSVFCEPCITASKIEWDKGLNKCVNCDRDISKI